MNEFLAYANSLESRLSKAEQSMKETFSLMHDVVERVDVVHASKKNEFEHATQQLEYVEIKLQELIKRTRLVVSAFQDAVHEKEFSRVESKVNSFKGEQFISRREFERILKEELAD